MIIEDAYIRKVFDCRGEITVEVEILTTSGFGRASAPSGASIGAHEVVTFPKQGIDSAITKFQDEVAPKLIGMDASSQREIDALLHEIDGTDDFSNIGGSVSVATSIAVAKAAADALCLPLYQYLGGTFADNLPSPMGNIIGGGKHAVGGTDIQEFLVISFADSVFDSIEANALVHAYVKERLQRMFRDRAIGKGDEGAWVAELGNEKALEMLSDVCDAVSSELNIEIRPALDIAASEIYRNGKYYYKEDVLNADEQIDFISELVEKYSLYSVEDPLQEEDFDGYTSLTETIGERCLVIGDDLFATNVNRLEKGISLKAGNAILIKPNQVGTLTDTYETIKLAHAHDFKTIISHRSGETEDNYVAHIAVAFNCHAIKTGAVGGERTAKLNELIRIEEELKQEKGE